MPLKPAARQLQTGFLELSSGFKDPQYEINGKSEYQFNVCFNEPIQESTGAAAVFKEGDDASAFFEVDPSLPCITGTMKYEDTIVDEVVTKSKVQVDLVGNKLTNVQIGNFMKMFFLISVVPVNSE